MSTKAVFVVSKQPFGTRDDGETTISRALIAAAAKVCSVEVVALADESAKLPSAAPVPLVEVPKPRISWPELISRSLVHRRSLIHTRFAPKSLRLALESITADVIVARRVYMAQAAIDAGRTPPRDRLLVLIDALESMVLRLRASPRQPLLELEARRTRRDEVRCIAAASQLTCFSDVEADELAGDFSVPHRLNFVLPPASEPASLADPLALFVGDRSWEPNADALRRLTKLWPQISAAVPRARLLVVGRPGSGEKVWHHPTAETVGFVRDIDPIWRSGGVLLAPVAIGGGVRVKILDAVRHGVPVVGTSAAVGSCSRYLPVVPCDSETEFSAAAITLLRDGPTRRDQGAALYEANRELAAGGYLERQLETLLLGRDQRAGVSTEPAASGSLPTGS